MGVKQRLTTFTFPKLNGVISLARKGITKNKIIALISNLAKENKPKNVKLMGKSLINSEELMWSPHNILSDYKRENSNDNTVKSSDNFVK